MRKEIVYLNFLLLGLKTAEIKTNDEVADGVSDLCKEAYYLTKLMTHIVTTADSADTAIQRTETDTAQWQLASAASNDATTRCLYQALAQKSSAHATTARQKAKAAKSPATKAVQKLAEHIGLINAAVATTALKLAETGNHHSAPDTSSVKLSLKLTAGGAPVCTPPANIGELAAGKTEIAYSRLAKLKLTATAKLLSAGKKLYLTIGGLTSCTQHTAEDQNMATTLESCSQTGSNSPPKGSQGIALEKYATTADPLFNGDDPSKGCVASDLKEDSEENRIHNLRHLICQALKATPIIPEDLRATSGDRLAADATIRNYVRNCVPELQKLKSSDEGQDKTTIETFVKEKYGKNNEEFKQRFVESLTKLRPVVRAGKTSEPTELTTISGGAFDATISYAEGERNKKELEAEKKDAAASKPAVSKKEEKCKDKPQSECKDKDVCEYKEGKYQVKVTTTTGTDGKRTNTTGSNSLVINK
uniref:Variant surface glycoprotein (VSG), putative n=1 Tax=Trypanosoma brucei TaxID=5691 RepID=Q57WM2_9TRYP|nr:variant surface glycoprotein (VSG), putative [Trypanosoma brucei]